MTGPRATKAQPPAEAIRWIGVNLLVIGLGALLLGHALTRVLLLELDPPARPRDPPAPPPPVTAPAAGPTPDPTATRERNIFCSTCAPQGEQVEAEPEAPTPPVLDSAELLATALSPDDPWASTATIRLRDTGRVRLVSVGSFLRRAIITHIGPSLVTYRQSDREEAIRYHYPPKKTRRRPGPKRRPPRKPSRKPDPWQQALAKGIQQVGPNKFRIARSLLQQAGAKPSSLARELSVRPYMERGHMVGYQLRRVLPGGALARMGLRTGDVLRSVNNQPVNSPDRLLSLYTLLPTARHMTIGLSRRNRPVSLDYAIQ